MVDGTTITREEFLARFKAEMLTHAQTFDDGSSVADYADEVGPTYWDNPEQRAEGPEVCADADVSYWGED